MVGWFRLEENRKLIEREKVLKSRRDDVMAYFKAEGYQPHQCVPSLLPRVPALKVVRRLFRSFDFDAWTKHPIMHVTKPLTESGELRELATPMDRPDALI